MKTVYVIVALMFFKITVVLSQVNLMVENVSVDKTVVTTGEFISIEAMVTNVGNDTSEMNYIDISFITSQLNSETGESGRVSLNKIGPDESRTIVFKKKIPSSFIAGEYSVCFTIDPLNSIPEQVDTLFCFNNITFNINNASKGKRSLPYPILMVHGWVGSSESWNAFTDDLDNLYGLQSGGQLNYCLNPDGNQATSDGYITKFTETSDLTDGDYYLMNFDVASDGTLYVGNDAILFNDDFSNQSAVTKQGWALSDAVAKILRVSGADKVILAGHSMGGVACREYVQNNTNWQTDNDHHIATLLTIATPNGGSNLATGLSFVSLLGFDESSEGIRDIRYAPNFPGQYLFGGDEQVNDLFHNNDINCNGSVGDHITGLNERAAPVDLNYSSIVGNFLNLGTDQLVLTERANLNNYLFAESPYADPVASLFVVNDDHVGILNDNPSVLMQGLDEPADSTKAYKLATNTLVHGFLSVQETEALDIDYYTFTMKHDDVLNLQLDNIATNEYHVTLQSANFDTIQHISSGGSGRVVLQQTLPEGKYYIKISGTPSADSWRFPYLMYAGVESELLSSTNDREKRRFSESIFFVYQNSSNGALAVSYESESTGDFEISLFNNSGQKLNSLKGVKREHYISKELPVSSISPGLYFVQIKTTSEVLSRKVLLY